MNDILSQPGLKWWNFPPGALFLLPVPVAMSGPEPGYLVGLPQNALTGLNEVNSTGCKSFIWDPVTFYSKPLREYVPTGFCPAVYYVPAPRQIIRDLLGSPAVHRRGLTANGSVYIVVVTLSRSTSSAVGNGSGQSSTRRSRVVLETLLIPQF